MPELNDQGQTIPASHVLKLNLLNNDAYKDMLYRLAEAETPLQDLVEQVRRDYITAALRLSRGRRYKAAERIGVHRNTLARHMVDKEGE